MITPLAWALKEWQVAVAALLAGQTVVLLRKGGLREERGRFALAARQVLLLPTLEHQTAALLKDEFHPLAAADSADDGLVRFTGWATITHALPLTTEAEVAALLPHLVWNERFIAERLNWQPQRPLYGLLLRAHRLEAPLVLPRHAGYGGCRSWVELGQTVAVDDSAAALNEADYQAQVSAILLALPAVVPVIP